jgi:antitoxin component YwqK of YwqJK toxin-antitoxin module
LFAIGEWKSDRLEGNPTWIFHRNSKILYSGAMAGSLRDGYGKTFYNNGEKCCKGVWAVGHGNCEKFEFYYINGQVKYTGGVRDGVYDGMGGLWWPNGGVRYEGGWKNGEVHGEEVELYYSNAQLEYRGGMEGGRIAGKAVRRYENGSLCFEGDLSVPLEKNEVWKLWELDKTYRSVKNRDVLDKSLGLTNFQLTGYYRALDQL